MTPSQTNTQNNKILDFLKRLAPYSIIDIGLTYARSGNVYELGKMGGRIFGAVKDKDDKSYSVTIDILSTSKVSAQCTCSSEAEMEEQWCPHAVAILWNASEMDFFEEQSGFHHKESTYKVRSSTPEEFGEVISELAFNIEDTIKANDDYEITIKLDCDTDRFGVQILINNDIQAPLIFGDINRTSLKSLDKILVALLDNNGSWDESGQLWYINSSSEIEQIIGIISDYKNIVASKDNAPISFAKDLIRATLHIEWDANGANLSMKWLNSSGEDLSRDNDVFGTGPYWTCIHNTIHKLSPSASKIASLFPSSRSIFFSRSDCAALLESLQEINPENEKFKSFIKIENENLCPKAEIKSPQPVINLSVKNTLSEHFSSYEKIEISAALDFEYPKPGKGENVVFLKNKKDEEFCKNALNNMGFQYSKETKTFIAGGDSALDIISSEKSVFPDNWEVNGFSAIKKGIKFSDLAVNLAMKENNDLDNKSNNWFECNITLTQNNSHIPISTLFKNARGEDSRWIKLDNGSYAKIPGQGLMLLKTTLGMIDHNYQTANTIRTTITKAQAYGLSTIDDYQFQMSVDPTLKAFKSRLEKFQEIKQIKASKKFEGKLRNYQQDGISWLNFLHEFDLAGILADEMGLGKTIQTLSFLQMQIEQKAKEKATKLPSLIICPTSIQTNWLMEAARFTPNLKAIALRGTQRKNLFKNLTDYDLIITTYALLRIDWAELVNQKFNYVILDEAQNIKNPLAATTKAAKSLKAAHRLVLTGTPSENRPLELWSIMDFILPGYLGTAEFFKNTIEKPILEGNEPEKVIRFLNNKTRPFILRRTKNEVEKDLPPKIESTMYTEMTQNQKELYLQILNEVKPQVLNEVKKKGIGGATVSILTALLRLRQICNHPNSIAGLKNFTRLDSGKFGLLKELITEALESNKKILVFSQFKEMLSIIREWLVETKINHVYLDGSTKDRQDIVDQFNQDEKIRLFLISLKAGGTGLNLPAADTVIIYDPWWNPAVENQAIDRAHRIGQTKTVNVYRLVTIDSVEQKIMHLKERKSKLVDALVNSNGLSTLKLTKADLEQLFESP